MTARGLAAKWLGVVLATVVALLAVARPVAADTTMIDIMLVYDTTATTWVSGNGGMAAFSEEVVNRMNQALQNSGVPLTFRLVHAMSVNYTTTSSPSSGLSSDLVALRGGAGPFADAHDARNVHGADLVALLVDTGDAYGSVGVGYLLGSWSGSSTYGFTANAVRSVAISHTLTHEVGHNLGAHHSKNQTADPGPNPYLDNQYSAGWYFNGTDGKAYHTIMSYNDDGHGNWYQSAPLFSTPLRTFQGTTVGHAQSGDNARLISETMGVVASYRTAVSPTTYALSVHSSGASSVAIGSPTSATYAGTTNYSRAGIAPNTSITLTAPATAGSMNFSQWSGCNSTSGFSCTVSMTANKTVTATYVAGTASLTAGVPVTNLAGSQGSTQFFGITVPTGATNLRITTSGGAGDVDLYVRFGGLPSLSEYHCRPWLDGNNETCTFASPTVGTYYIMLHGHAAFSGVTLTASYDVATICPYDDHRVLQYATVNGVESHSACRTITAGPAWIVAAAGNATLRAGERITLQPGFRIQAGGRFRAEIDPSLRP